MLLSDRDIADEIAAGHLVVDGDLRSDSFQPASLDVHLAAEFRVFPSHQVTHIDPAAEQILLTRRVNVRPGDSFILHPGEFALGCTVEAITLDESLAARLEGKSSLGRLGLLTHSTAGWIDPGFTGQITLELSNVNTLPIKLCPGMKIGQLCLFRLASPALRPYGHPGLGSRYQGQQGPAASRPQRLV
jgi:dCTP deaminase